jgi:hypothetical protein
VHGLQEPFQSRVCINITVIPPLGAGSFAQDAVLTFVSLDNRTTLDSPRGPSHKSPSIGSKGSKDSSDLRNRSGGGMAGMLDTDRSRTRRERTFVGSECAVCEEPLEHTLRGERILQFSCSHVSHEACFYEYIKEFESQYCPTCNAPLGLDTSRGGNVLDIGKKFDSGSYIPARQLISNFVFREAK